MKDRYLIGEVCKLFNISRDTLVHYDKKSLLSPKKDKSNGYRYYTIEDLNCLTDIIFYKMPKILRVKFCKIQLKYCKNK